MTSMDATVFVRQPNAREYTDLGSKNFSVLPRVDEYLSVTEEGSLKYYQVIGVHHSLKEGAIEIYCVQTEPSWEVKEPRAIGFGPR